MMSIHGRTRAAIAGAFALLLLPFALRAGMDATERDRRAFDAQITEELRQMNPNAVPLFVQANRERDQNRHQAAVDHYAQVVTLAPRFDHAMRREAYQLQILSKRNEAIPLQRRALELNKSPENMMGLAMLLMQTAAPSDAEKREALALTNQVLGSATRDVAVLIEVTMVAMMNNEADLVQAAATRLMAAAPERFESHYANAYALAMNGKLRSGRKELDVARSLGLPEESYQSSAQAFDRAQPLWQKIVLYGSYVAVPWAVGLGVLFAAGFALSGMALRASTELPREEGAHAGSFGHGLRRIYAVVIALASAYYYISIPIVLVLTLALLGGFLYFFVALGHIPAQLIVVAMVVGGVSVMAMLRSIFVRVRDDDPGERLDLSAHPRFRECLDEVARRIGTRPVDSVYLTPGTELAVMERGGFWKRGARERCLILGAGILDGFALQPFKAVLGHEYGHLTNRDTAGGGFALRARNSLGEAAMQVARGGAARWYNPSWLFLKNYYKVFVRITQGASRFQEAMADRWAAFAYGTEAFEEGLRHVVTRSVTFDAFTDAALSRAINRGVPLPRLYEAANYPAADTEADVRARLEAESSPYDSHPSFRERVAWVQKLNIPCDASAAEEETVWSLFSDRAGIEQIATEVVRRNVKRQYAIDLATE
jgi:Zn-dependent protease with chaperone function